MLKKTIFYSKRRNCHRNEYMNQKETAYLAMRSLLTNKAYKNNKDGCLCGYSLFLP